MEIPFSFEVENEVFCVCNIHVLLLKYVYTEMVCSLQILRSRLERLSFGNTEAYRGMQGV